jgi:hypothetical protein
VKEEEVAGNLYRVTLDVDDADLLDWDKPLSEQSEKVKAALTAFPNSMNGRDIYGDVSRKNVIPRIERNVEILDYNDAQIRASKFLQSRGISGIRYLDGNSRSDGEGSYNYVIFDESLIKITSENGQPVDLSESQEVDDSSFSIGTTTDAEYLKLAKDPKKNAEQLRAMVNEVAKTAGYDIEAFHGTNSKFTVFDTNGRGKTEGSGAFFTTNRSNAASYGKNILQVFLKADGPQIDAHGANWNNLSLHEAYDENGDPIGEFDTFDEAQKPQAATAM